MPYADKVKERECQRRYSLSARHQRQSAISTWKLDQGCADCGYAAHPEALDFDHVRGDKEFDCIVIDAEVEEG